MYIRRFLYRHKLWYKTWRKILTIMSHIMFAVKPPVIKACHIRELLVYAQSGDIIVRKYSYYLSTLYIPGEYSHSGIVIDTNTMIHAVGEGIQTVDIIDFVKDCDGFLLLRPQYASPLNQELAISFAKNHLGCDYDYLFDNISDEAFYCHELSWRCLEAGCMTCGRLDSEYIIADDLISLCKKVLICPEPISGV